MSQRVQSSMEIGVPAGEVYAYWEDLHNLPRSMRNVEEVRITEPGASRWRIKGPFGTNIHFEAHTTRREDGRELAWHTVCGNAGSSGTVRFREVSPERSRVEVSLEYCDLPGGKLARTFSRHLADPGLMVEQDLANLRDVLEKRATPEQIQRRLSAANVQSVVVALFGCAALLAASGAVGLVISLARRGEEMRNASHPDQSPLFWTTAPEQRSRSPGARSPGAGIESCWQRAVGKIGCNPRK